MPFFAHDDPAVAALVEKERSRQQSTLNLIADEVSAYLLVDMALIAGWIDRILSQPDDAGASRSVREDVQALCRR